LKGVNLSSHGPAVTPRDLARVLAAGTVRRCYRDAVRNITVSVPDDIYRAARIRAAERGTSVSALVGEYLRSLSEDEADFLRLEAQQRRVLEQVSNFQAGDRLSREELYNREVR
jgi:plasmid stability protein